MSTVVLASFAQVSVVIDTLPMRAEWQQIAFHEPGFEIDQNNGDLYYGGTTGLYYSNDGGQLWSYNDFEVSGNLRAIHYLEMNQSTGRVYAGSTDGGIGYTDDMGATWTILHTSSTYAIYIDDNICMASVGAVFRWTDGDWNSRVMALPLGADGLTPGDLGELYAVSEGEEEIWMSRDNGETWTLAIATDDEPKFILPKSNEEVIYGVWNNESFQSDTTFSNPTLIGGTILGGAKTEDGFMWMIQNSTAHIFSDDDGDTRESVFGGNWTTLLNGVAPPSIDADGIRDQMDTYNGAIYLAETQGRVYRAISGAVGVAETNINELGLYPNPATDMLRIEADAAMQNGRYSIFDATGRLVLSGQMTGRVDVSMLPVGTYQLQLSNEQLSQTLPFMKL